MPTPSSQIGFSDLNVEILQQASTTQTDLNTSGVRLGYGSTGQVSISQLRKAYGATVTCGPAQQIAKGIQAVGYFGGQPAPATGSVDDQIIDGSAPANARFIRAYSSTVSGVQTSTQLGWMELTTSTAYANGSFQRCAIGGTVYTSQATQTSSPAIINGQQRALTIVQLANTQYLFPASGTVTVGLKWS